MPEVQAQLFMLILDQVRQQYGQLCEVEVEDEVEVVNVIYIFLDDQQQMFDLNDQTKVSHIVSKIIDHHLPCLQ